jgi:hypothetical protein
MYSIELKTNVKKCIFCGKEALYIIAPNNIFSWRLCFRHLPVTIINNLKDFLDTGWIFYIEQNKKLPTLGYDSMNQEEKTELIDKFLRYYKVIN